MHSCPICKGLHESVASDGGHRLKTVHDAVKNGCSTCTILRDAISKIKPSAIHEQDIKIAWDTNRLDGIRIVAHRQTPLEASGEVGNVWGSSFLFSIDIFARPGDQGFWKSNRHPEKATDISGDTSSDEAFRRLHFWLERCENNHSCAPSGPTLLPKRILDISNPEYVRLYLSKSDETGKYACLSHCWGTSKTLTTTTENINIHQDSIDWKAIPKTFQNAIMVTRKLGIGYLWVDSLCIIQDSDEDWRDQSTKMSDIYANSFLTIAATKASSDSEGFFAQAPKERMTTTLTYTDDNGYARTIGLRGALGHGQSQETLPLLARAWVLQERLLSPRVIHFTNDEVVWECMEQTTCECGCVRSLWSPGWQAFNKDELHEPKLKGMPHSSIRSTWHEIVAEFSRLDITISQDRLAAISGAAKRFAPHRRGSYVAGVWSDSIVKDMMWSRRNPLHPSARIAGAPSWSWASVESQIMYEEAMGVLEFAVVSSIETQNVTDDDPFSEVLTGSMQVSGLFAPLCLETLTTHVTSRSAVDVRFDTETDAQAPQLNCLKLATQQNYARNVMEEEVSLILIPVFEQAHTYRRAGLLRVDLHSLAVESGLYDVVESSTLILI